jgi:RNA polymerase subunit RPABC4/transcription elongation factor Spt4
MYCSECGQQVNEGARFCPRCGSAVQRSPVASEPVGRPPIPHLETNAPPPTLEGSLRPPLAVGMSPSSFNFDWSRFLVGDLFAGIGSAVVLLSIFLPWYSLDGFIDEPGTFHGWLYITLFISLGIIFYLIFVTGSGRDINGIRREALLGPAAGINVLLTLIALIDKPIGFTYSFAGFLAVLAACAAGIGALSPLVQGAEWFRRPIVTPSGTAPPPLYGVSPHPAVVTGRFCSGCGTRLEAKESFCRNCGHGPQ